MLLDHETPNIDLINSSSLIFFINVTPELSHVDNDEHTCEAALTVMSLSMGIHSQPFSSEEASEDIKI